LPYIGAHMPACVLRADGWDMSREKSHESESESESQKPCASLDAVKAYLYSKVQATGFVYLFLSFCIRIYCELCIRTNYAYKVENDCRCVP
jgi:hypothetical protein